GAYTGAPAAHLEGPPAHPLRARRKPAVLPGALRHVLGRVPAVGRDDARLPPRQRGDARPRRDAAVGRAAAARDPRRAARGGGVRAAPGARRIGGVDLRAPEYALRRLLPRG